MNKPVHFHLTQQALDIAERRAVSPNKRGLWISQAIVEYDKLLTIQELTDPARLARIETDVAEIRSQLAKLLAKE